MGDRAGRVIVGSWRWLWGLPVESGGKVAVAVAEKSLQSMQESVQQLAKAVAQQVGAYERARTKYRDKIDELRAYEQQARLAQRAGQVDRARLAMSALFRSKSSFQLSINRCSKLERLSRHRSTNSTGSASSLNNTSLICRTSRISPRSMLPLSRSPR